MAAAALTDTSGMSRNTERVVETLRLCLSALLMLHFLMTKVPFSSNSSVLEDISMGANVSSLVLVSDSRRDE